MAFLQDDTLPGPVNPTSPTGLSGMTFTALAQRYGAPSAGGGGAEPVPTVYLGRTSRSLRRYSKESDMEQRASYSTDKTNTLAGLMAEFDNFSKDKKRQLALQLVLAGYIGGGSSVDEAAKVASELTLMEVQEGYQALLEDAAMHYSAGEKLTPSELLRRHIDFRLPDGFDWDGKLGSLSPDKFGTDNGDGTFTTKRTQMSILDPQDARAMVRQTLLSELGREPTKAEYEDFLGALNFAQRANPTTVTTTSTVKDGRVVSSMDSVDEGIGTAGLQQMTDEKARNQPGWAEWQAVGTYAPALFEALGAAVPGV